MLTEKEGGPMSLDVLLPIRLECVLLQRLPLGAWLPCSGTSRAKFGRPAPRPRYSALDVGKYEKSTSARVSTWNEAAVAHLTSVT